MNRWKESIRHENYVVQFREFSDSNQFWKNVCIGTSKIRTIRKHGILFQETYRKQAIEWQFDKLKLLPSKGRNKSEFGHLITSLNFQKENTLWEGYKI